MRNILCLLFLVSVIAGCGPNDTPVAVTPPAAEVELKGILEGLAESGESLGSGGMVIGENIEEIRKTDSAKADKLQKSADELIGASESSKIKSLAKTMLKDLE